MGQSNSILSDQNNRILQQQLKCLDLSHPKDYQFVVKRQDDSILVINHQTLQYHLLRKLTVTAQEDVLSLTKILEKRNKINSVHLCKITAVKKSQENLACSQIYRLHLLIQCPPKSLRNLLQQKISHYQSNNLKLFFKEEQLWGIAYSVVKALKSIYLYGMVHESLTLDCILIDQKGLIKLADPALFGLQKNYITAMKQKRNCNKILSPEILVFLDEFNFYFYEKQKSDIFVLGILILQLSTLNEFPVYDFKQKRARFQLIQINLSQIKNRYSSKFNGLLEWMTQIEPKKRPKLGQLLEFIDKNNSSEKSTSIQNTITDFSQTNNKLQTDKNFQRNKTVSQFNTQSLPNSQQKPSSFMLNQTPIIEKEKIETENIGRRNETESSGGHVFPFQLVYNRIISNNQNMKPFQIQQLCKQYRYNEMFGSSCRGSVPNSSYHARIEHPSKEIPHKNMKAYDYMAFSKRSYSKGDNLIYSQSSAYQGSNRLEYSKNTLGDIKLVESNHLKQHVEPKRYVKEEYFRVSNIMEDANQHSSIQSPYRQLNSQRNSQVKSLTSIRNFQAEPIINMQTKEFSRSDILQQYDNKAKEISLQSAHNNQFENKYFSQEKQKESKNLIMSSPWQEYQSEFLRIDRKSFHQLNDKKQADQKAQNEYDMYLLSDKVINKESEKNILSKLRIDSQRMVSFQSSEMGSKFSRLTPNFPSESHKQMGSEKEALFEDLNSSIKQQLIFVQNDLQQDNSIYTGYKTKQGKKQRHGKLEFHDGGYYQGQWKNDKMQGYGQLYYANGILAYKGSWADGCFSGNGQIFNDKPLYFEGSFNYRNFTEIEDKWLSYEGQFQNDSKHGRGRISLTNGEYFEGTFDYDMIEGYGSFYAKNGQIIKGLWRDNELLQQYD